MAENRHLETARELRWHGSEFIAFSWNYYLLNKFFSKQKQPRPKRVPSTTENLEDDKRKHMSQPVPNQLTNVEQKNKAKKRRESRRSTQGVTLDIVKEAKNFVEETKKESKRKNITTGSTAG